MIRVVVVADSGSVLASLTAASRTVPGAYIVRHASSSAPLDRVLAPLEVDLVLIGDLLFPDDALTRLAEVRRAAPAAKVVLLSSSPEAAWLADALRAEASAVLPGQLEPETLGLVLREVLETGAAVLPFPERPTDVQPATGAAA
jgi:DNA-binding NarL/FixJ family response regulator